MIIVGFDVIGTWISLKFPNIFCILCSDVFLWVKQHFTLSMFLKRQIKIWAALSEWWQFQRRTYVQHEHLHIPATIHNKFHIHPSWLCSSAITEALPPLKDVLSCSLIPKSVFFTKKVKYLLLQASWLLINGKRASWANVRCWDFHKRWVLRVEKFTNTFLNNDFIHEGKDKGGKRSKKSH